MNFDEWRTAERMAVQAIGELSRLGIKVRTGRGTPITTAGILADQTRRAFDAAIENDEPIGFGYDDDRDGGDQGDVDDECRRAAHRTLDRLIKAHHARRRSGGKISDEEKQDLQAMLTLLPLHNAFPPSGRTVGRALDVDEDDLTRMQRATFDSCGVF